MSIRIVGYDKDHRRIVVNEGPQDSLDMSASLEEVERMTNRPLIVRRPGRSISLPSRSKGAR